MAEQRRDRLGRANDPERTEADNGAPEATYPPEIRSLLAQQKKAEEAGDLDRVNAIKARS